MELNEQHPTDGSENREKNQGSTADQPVDSSIDNSVDNLPTEEEMINSGEEISEESNLDEIDLDSIDIDEYDEEEKSRPRVRRDVEENKEARSLADHCVELVLEKKGNDVVMLNLTGLTDIADYFVLCSCDNDVHVKAVAENLRDKLGEEGIRPWKTEGWQGNTWVIMDYVEVVVHVFYRETRHFYNLERLWSDAPSERFSDDPLQK